MFRRIKSFIIKPRNKLFSKLLILFIISANVYFAKTVLDIFKTIGSEPSALIGAWFGFTTVELWNLASIKKKEIDSDDRNSNDVNWDDNDSDR